MTNTISFPSLGITFDINPVAFTFSGKAIYWYGIIIALGLCVAIAVALKLAKYDGIKSDTVLDIVIFGAPSAIICARIYYVIFNFSYYKDNLSEIVKIWEGGIAIYGAIIGALISTCIYCRVKKVNLKKVLDFGAVGLLIGQCIGRWGNFVNAEAYGAQTSLPWKMRIYESAGVFYDVHPTFLYESLWNLLTSFFLIILYKKKKYDGQIFWLYILIYGLGRVWIEGLRTDSLYLGPFRISQIVAIISIFVGAFVLIKNKIRTSKTNF